MRSYWIALLALAPATALAWGERCEFRADRAGGVDARGVEKVVIRAGAGDMKVVGRSNAVRVEARGTACASNQPLLETTQIVVRREGNVVYVETQMPQDREQDMGWKDYAYIDLGVALPSSIPLEALDSSGDAEFEDLKSIEVQDSSGDLQITRVTELVDVNDSSGDLEIEGAGSVRVRDSSGDITVNDTRGNVDVSQDSSGDIHVVKVGGNVVVDQDSSGEIRVEDVRGNFTVNSDSAGDIYAGRVGGDFTVNEDSTGSIEHEGVRGRITVPQDHKAYNVE